MKRFLSVFLAVLSIMTFCSCSSEEAEKVVSEVVSQLEMTEAEDETTAEETNEDTDTAVGEETQASAEEATEALTAEETQPPEEDSPAPTEQDTQEEYSEEEVLIDEYGTYTTKEDVALYIHTYGKLPDNFITKQQAQELGWQGGSLEPYAPGMCIGGNRFGNYEGILPEKSGRKYTECDIDTLGASKRGAKRIVFSNDGLIYYTEDHYESFELLYGEE